MGDKPKFSFKKKDDKAPKDDTDPKKDKVDPKDAKKPDPKDSGKPESKDGKKPVDDGKKPAFGGGKPGADKNPKDPKNAKPDDKKLGTRADAKVKEKTKGPEITDKVKVDFEPTISEEELAYILGDLDLEEVMEDVEVELLALHEELAMTETLSYQGRMKRRMTMRRFRSRIKNARSRAVRRRATTSQISRRARRTAISRLKTRFAAGRSISSLGHSEKSRLERMVSARKPSVNRMSNRLRREKRVLDSYRLRKR